MLRDSEVVDGQPSTIHAGLDSAEALVKDAPTAVTLLTLILQKCSSKNAAAEKNRYPTKPDHLLYALLKVKYTRGGEIGIRRRHAGTRRVTEYKREHKKSTATKMKPRAEAIMTSASAKADTGQQAGGGGCRVEVLVPDLGTWYSRQQQTAYSPNNIITPRAISVSTPSTLFTLSTAAVQQNPLLAYCCQQYPACSSTSSTLHLLLYIGTPTNNSE